MKKFSLFLLCAVLCLTAKAQAGGNLFKKHKSENVISIEVTTNAGASTTLGSTFNISVKANESNGKKSYSFTTPEVPWSEFDVVVKGGTFSNGKVVAAKKLSETEGGKISVKITYKPKPDLDTTLFIDLITGKDLVLDFNGKDGGHGASGSAGENGRVRATGDNCREGEPGGNGDAGSDGEDAPEIEVYLKKLNVPVLGKEMICVLVVNMSVNDTSQYYMDLAGSITIMCNGGNGGTGGSGGIGGIGTKNSVGVECKGGNGGTGGNGGKAGNGGKITVRVDPSVDLTRYNIKFVNESGKGGSGGYGAIGGAHGENTAPVEGRRGTDGKNGKEGLTGKAGPKPFIKNEPVSTRLFAL